MLGLTFTGLTGELHRLGEGIEEPPGGGHGSVDPRDVGQQQGELVAAEPGDGVLVAHAVTHPLRRLAEQLVAGGVAEAVIDALEAIEVDDHDRHRKVVAPGVRQRPVTSRSPNSIRLGRPVSAVVIRAPLDHAPLQEQAAQIGGQHDRGDSGADGRGGRDGFPPECMEGDHRRRRQASPSP